MADEKGKTDWTSWWDREDKDVRGITDRFDKRDRYADDYDKDEETWSFWSRVGSKAKGRSYSSYWSRRFDSYGSYGGSDYDKYIEILRSVRRSANVVGTRVNSSGEEREITVQWAGDNCFNSTKSDVVYLSPTVVDGTDSTEGSRWTQDERTDVLIAEALAESTLKRTMDPLVEESMTRLICDPHDKKYPRNVLSHHLWTVLERLHAESEVAGEYPGFSGYFAAYRSYYTSPGAYKQITKLLADDECAGSALKALMWELLHPEKHLEPSKKVVDALKFAFGEIAEARSSPSRASCALAVVEDFFRRWPDDPINDGRGRTPERAKREASDPYLEFFKGLTVEKSQAARSRAGDARLGTKVGARCSAVAGDKELADGSFECPGAPGESASTLSELAQYKVGTSTIKVEEYAGDKAGYASLRTQLAPAIAALRSQLRLRTEDNRMIEHGLKKGRLDEGSLFKLGLVEERNIFEIEETPSPPKIALGLLLDESGSMQGYKAAETRNAAVVMLEAVRGMADLEVCILGHTGQGHCHRKMVPGLLMAHFVTPELIDNSASLMQVQGFCQNLDGYAIAQMAQLMIGWYDNSYQRVLIHISDGVPGAHDYGGPPAVRHVYKSCVAAKREGVRVLGIGICNSFGAEQGRALYGPGNCVILPDAKAAIPLGNFLREVALRKGE